MFIKVQIQILVGRIVIISMVKDMMGHLICQDTNYSAGKLDINLKEAVDLAEISADTTKCYVKILMKTSNKSSK